MSIPPDHRASKWQRVTRARPCPVCGKPDWCLYAGPEGDPTAAICARTESAKRCGEAGWLHRLRDDPLWHPGRRPVRSVSLPPRPVPWEDLGKLAESFQAAVDPDQLNRLALSLGLAVESLNALGIGWSAAQRAWSFPMRDAAGTVLGIRLRRPNGFKFAVAGSKEGLFFPLGSGQGGALLVCEGPTDTAALLDLGFAGAVGRPSCTGGVKRLVELVRHRRPREVAVVADNDEPGRRGADNLASVLAAYAPAVRIIAPPAEARDARAWLQAGGTAADVLRAIEASPVRRLQIRTVGVR